MSKIATVQCEESFDTYYVNAMYADGSSAEAKEFSNKQKAEEYAKKLSKKYAVNWETNY